MNLQNSREITFKTTQDNSVDVHNQRPTLGFESRKTQRKTILNNLSTNSYTLSVIYTNTDNLINQRSELPTITSADNTDIISITETLTLERLINMTKGAVVRQSFKTNYWKWYV